MLNIQFFLAVKYKQFISLFFVFIVSFVVFFVQHTTAIVVVSYTYFILSILAGTSSVVCVSFVLLLLLLPSLLLLTNNNAYKTISCTSIVYMYIPYTVYEPINGRHTHSEQSVGEFPVGFFSLFHIFSFT